jgi:hypothetical protein
MPPDWLHIVNASRAAAFEIPQSAKSGVAVLPLIGLGYIATIWRRLSMSQAEVTRDEFTRLQGRVSTIGQETDGEKMLSRYILTQSPQMATIWRC